MEMVIDACPKCGTKSFWADLRKAADAVGLVVTSYTCGGCGWRVEVEPDAEAAKRILAPDPRRVKPE